MFTISFHISNIISRVLFVQNVAKYLLYQYIWGGHSSIQFWLGQMKCSRRLEHAIEHISHFRIANNKQVQIFAIIESDSE